MLALIGENIFMICCLSKKLAEKQNKALFLDHPVYMFLLNAKHFERINGNSQLLYNCVTAESYSAFLRQAIKKKAHTH